jgi:hypothetical protein
VPAAQDRGSPKPSRLQNASSARLPGRGAMVVTDHRHGASRARLAPARNFKGAALPSHSGRMGRRSAHRAAGGPRCGSACVDQRVLAPLGLGRERALARSRGPGTPSADPNTHTSAQCLRADTRRPSRRCRPACRSACAPPLRAASVPGPDEQVGVHRRGSRRSRPRGDQRHLLVVEQVAHGSTSSLALMAR